MTYSSKNINNLFIGLVVLLAFTVKSFIPIGFMPSFDMSGTKTMVLCTSHGQKTIQVDQNNNPIESQGTETSSDSNCHYATAFSKGFSFVADYNFTVPVLEKLSVFTYSSSFYINYIFKYYSSQGPPYNSFT